MEAESHDVSSKREDVIDEIRQTERTYVTGLTVLLNEFYEPIKQFLTQQSQQAMSTEVQKIFAPVTIIKGVNERLLCDLECLELQSLSIGEVFQQVTPLLKTYSMYVSNFSATSERLRSILKNSPQLMLLVTDKNNEMKKRGQMTFSQLLSTPCQRIPRYNLLLAELAKHATDEREIFYLRQALEKTKEITDFVNESVREFENHKKMVFLRGQIYGLEMLKEEFIQPSRKLITSGAVLKNSSRKPRSLYLFTDMVLITKQHSFRNVCRRYFKFSDCPRPWVRELSGFIFELVTKDGLFSFKTETREERKKWVEDIQRQIDMLCQHNPKYKEYPISDPAVIEQYSQVMRRKRLSLYIKKKLHVDLYAKFNDSDGSASESTPEAEKVGETVRSAPAPLLKAQSEPTVVVLPDRRKTLRLPRTFEDSIHPVARACYTRSRSVNGLSEQTARDFGYPVISEGYLR